MTDGSTLRRARCPRCGEDALASRWRGRVLLLEPFPMAPHEVTDGDRFAWSRTRGLVALEDASTARVRECLGRHQCDWEPPPEDDDDRADAGAGPLDVGGPEPPLPSAPALARRGARVRGTPPVRRSLDDLLPPVRRRPAPDDG